MLAGAEEHRTICTTVLASLWRGMILIQPSCSLHRIVYVNLSFCFFGNTKIYVQGTSALVSIAALLSFTVLFTCLSYKWLEESIVYSLEQLLVQTQVLTVGALGRFGQDGHLCRSHRHVWPGRMLDTKVTLVRNVGWGGSFVAPGAEGWTLTNLSLSQG